MIRKDVLNFFLNVLKKSLLNFKLNIKVCQHYRHVDKNKKATDNAGIVVFSTDKVDKKLGNIKYNFKQSNNV